MINTEIFIKPLQYMQSMAIDFKDLEQQITERGRIQTLDNGLTVISENVPGSGLAMGQIIIYTGSGYESPEDDGIMHFLEHVRFGGSRLYPDRNARNLQAGILGLKINAETGPFSVTYPVHGDNPSKYMLHQNFAQGFRLMSDIAFFPNISEESRQRELSVVQREIKERAQEAAANPFHQAVKTIRDRIHGNNLFMNKKSAGTEESIAKITVQKLKEYHSRFFVANNVLVELLGDLNGMANLEGVIGDALREIPAGTKAAPLEILPEKPYEGRERLNLQSPIQGDAKVDIYFHTPPSHSLDSCASSLLSHILGGGTNSLLFQNIRETRGLVYSISTHVGGHAKTGFLQIRYSVSPNQVENSLQAVDDSIQKLKTGQFNDSLIDAAKAGYMPNILAQLKNPGWIQSELMDRHYVERFGYESTILQKINTWFSLGKKDVISAANKYLGENRLTVVVM